MRALVIQIERTKERTAETCAFAQSPVRIGRNPLNDVELDDGYVSQWHGVIRFDDDHTSYLDLGSTNPTLIDGNTVGRNKEVPITDTTDLRIGSFRLHVFRVEDAPAELFGARRKTAFARTGVGDASSVATTMYLSEPTKLRSQSAVHALLSGLGDPGHSLGGSPPSGSPPVMQPLRGATASPLSTPSAPPAMNTPMRPISTNPPPLPARPSARPAGPSSVSVAPPVAVTGSQGNSHGDPRAAANAQPGASVRPRTASSHPHAQSDVQPVSHAGSSEDALRQAYASYRQSWRVLLATMRSRLQQAPTGQQEALLDALVQEFPEVGHEADFRSLLPDFGISPLRTGVPEMEDWLRRLTDNMFPPANASINLALAMERIGEVLEVFSTAFVELRDAQGRFCDEMSLDRPPSDSILQTTKNPRLALAYLLNPSSEGSSKVEELARSMADFALHQVALVSAVVEGARNVLTELSPETVSKPDPKAPKPGLFARMFSNEADGTIQRYRAAFAEMIDEDRFTRRLFGRAFARKYYAIMGGRRSLTPSR